MVCVPHEQTQTDETMNRRYGPFENNVLWTKTTAAKCYAKVHFSSVPCVCLSIRS